MSNELWNLHRAAEPDAAANEIAKLREQLEFQTKQGADRLIGLCKCGLERDELKQRAEEAEAKLKALDEQEPIGYVAHQVLINLANGVRYGGARITPRVDEEDECIAAIYAKPVPPVDVQQISGMSLAMGIASTVGDRIAELERKLAEQQERTYAAKRKGE